VLAGSFNVDSCRRCRWSAALVIGSGGWVVECGRGGVVPVRGAVLRSAGVILRRGHGAAARRVRAALPRSAPCVCRGASPAQCARCRSKQAHAGAGKRAGRARPRALAPRTAGSGGPQAVMASRPSWGTVDVLTGDGLADPDPGNGRTVILLATCSEHESVRVGPWPRRSPNTRGHSQGSGSVAGMSPMRRQAISRVCATRSSASGPVSPRCRA
jgi:hypothetical protein